MEIANSVPAAIRDPNLEAISQTEESDPQTFQNVPATDVDKKLDEAKQTAEDLKNLALQAEALMRVRRTAQDMVESNQPGVISCSIAFSAEEKALLQSVGINPEDDPHSIINQLQGKIDALKEQISEGMAKLEGDVGQVDSQVGSMEHSMS